MSSSHEDVRVLLVDDQLQIRNAYQRVLGKAGYAVTTADDTTGAIAELRLHDFDIVLTDLSLPSGTGLDILAAAHAVDPGMPVVFVTGTGDVAIARQALDHGALRYLIKPCTAAHLLAAVDEACRARAASSTAIGNKSTTRMRVLEGDLAKVERAAAFDGALDQLWMALQPVVAMGRRRVIAYEALVRSTHPTLGRPDLLIAAAEELGRLDDLGRKIRATVAARMSEAPSEVDILVNLHPEDLADPELYDPAAPLSAHAARVILEITERASLDQIKDVQERIAALRKLGYRIAVDDLGAGYGSLSAMALIRPDLVKIDMSLVRNVHADPVRMRMIKSIGQMCQQLGTPWLCEGVETVEELHALVDNGVDLVQGYLLGRPLLAMESPPAALFDAMPRPSRAKRPSQRIAIGGMAKVVCKEALAVAAGVPSIPSELRSLLGALHDLLEQMVEGT
jgi:EAL domain-containing protein (putative c-di-GMP-specific phosphodiesterase class I)/CheY-like chemotaxis protein